MAVRRSLFAVLMVLAGLAGACGDDESGASDAFCDTARDVADDLPFMVVDIEDPGDITAMKEFIASWALDAPEDIARDMLLVADDFEAFNEDLGNAEVSGEELEARHAAYLRANERLVAFVQDECDVDLTPVPGG